MILIATSDLFIATNVVLDLAIRKLRTFDLDDLSISFRKSLIDFCNGFYDFRV